MATTTFEGTMPQLEDELMRARSVANMGRSLAELRMNHALLVAVPGAEERRSQLSAAIEGTETDMARTAARFGDDEILIAAPGTVFGVWSAEHATVDTFRLDDGGQWHPEPHAGNLRTDDRVYPDGFNVAIEDAGGRQVAIPSGMIAIDQDDPDVPGAVYAYAQTGDGQLTKFDITDEGFHVDILPEPPAHATLVRASGRPEWHPVVSE